MLVFNAQPTGSVTNGDCYGEDLYLMTIGSLVRMQLLGCDCPPSTYPPPPPKKKTKKQPNPQPQNNKTQQNSNKQTIKQLQNKNKTNKRAEQRVDGERRRGRFIKVAAEINVYSIIVHKAERERGGGGGGERDARTHSCAQKT